MLYLIKSECNVPDPFQAKNTRIFVAESFLRSTAGHRLKKLIPRMKKVEVSLAKLRGAPVNFLMIFREWMYERIFEGDMSVLINDCRPDLPPFLVPP